MATAAGKHGRVSPCPREGNRMARERSCRRRMRRPCPKLRTSRARSVPVTVRFSDGPPDPAIPDNSPGRWAPARAAWQFASVSPAAGKPTSSRCRTTASLSAPGKIFWPFKKPSWRPIPASHTHGRSKVFLGSHPLALKFVQEIQVTPASFATQAFFSNNAFIFVNKDGVKQAGRYQFLPVAGQKSLSEGEAKAKPAEFSGRRPQVAAGDRAGQVSHDRATSQPRRSYQRWLARLA